MGFESAFTLYRKYNKFVVSEEDKQKMIDAYAEANKSYDWSSTDEEKSKIDYSKDLPIVMSNHIGMDYDERKKLGIDSIRNQYFIDYHPVDKLIETWFCSNSRFIADEFSLGHGNKRIDNECVISKHEAEKMREAISYLLNGEYSKKIEAAMNNKWIKAFGDEYPKHYHKKNSNIYLDKIESGSYKISFGDEEGEIEYDEDNLEIERMMNDIKMMLDAYLNCESYNDDDELVLVYSISY